jgi:hypothetical protein
MFMRSAILQRVGKITDYGRPMKPFFYQKSQTFGLGHTIWADKFWGILGIFGQTISTHLGLPCPCFPLINHYFYKKLSLYIHIPDIYLGLGFEFGPQRNSNLSIVCP